ncbi:hypothetical protein APR50_17085 [Variovorax paradoxus]|jgi:uncharacterized protein YmfQ (DUF2313 family)|uniref:YmfQ family protein n=1 Tax=Variovorax paradoxus TaxID=34073 RepID=UPI0006E5AC82|nr:hypothetical protein APR50_17085 [Variovorax paradoxus]KPV06760.1 hypothetical protein APR49_19235 [Variovorax paradoxus]KPV32272.1 hypothetical protein APR48_14280 [Variovorax paradoxus]KPV34930.1 hypothetical protein APR47_14480 [Variovorax paradoxus]
MGGLTVSSWLSALQALLPPGLALTRDPSARLTRLLEAIAAQMTAAQGRLEALLVEWDPRRATTMLPDWERFLGLPDDCMADVALTSNERRVVAFQRLTELGGQSAAYFIDLAARFGEQNVQVFDGYRPMNCNGDCNQAVYSEADCFVWYVMFDHPAANKRRMTCNDDCSDALQMYTPSLAECPISERKPAHTTVLFAYMETSAEVINLLAQFALVDTLVLAP